MGIAALISQTLSSWGFTGYKSIGQWTTSDGGPTNLKVEVKAMLFVLKLGIQTHVPTAYLYSQAG